jgi:hypothetical protein
MEHICGDTVPLSLPIFPYTNIIGPLLILFSICFQCSYLFFILFHLLFHIFLISLGSKGHISVVSV